MLNQVCFSSFVHGHRERVERVRVELEVQSHIEFGFLVWQTVDFVNYRRTAIRGDTLNIDIELLLKHEELILEEIRIALEEGLKLKFYFGFDQVEDHQIYKRLEDLRVDTIIINQPMISLGYVNPRLL